MENVKTLTTPEKKEVTIITRLTAGQRNRIRRTVYRTLKMGMSTDPTKTPTPVVESLNLDAVDENEKVLIDVAVIKYDGKEADIYNTLLNASPAEYDFVLKAIDENLKDSLKSF